VRDLRLDDRVQLSGGDDRAGPMRGAACGKAILLGEHFVVHGAPAIAVPVLGRGVTVAWSPRSPRSQDGPTTEAEALVAMMLRALGVDARAIELTITSTLPLGSGLGSSAALAVALVRALGERDPERVRARAHELERLAHGNPSGIDDAVVAFERSVVFRRGAEPPLRVLDVPPLSLWIAIVPRTAATREAVAGVARWADAHPDQFQGMLREMGSLVDEALVALGRADDARTGALMDRAHALLDAIGVVDGRHAELVRAARSAGALGAKTTGGGHGGAVIALAPPTLDLEPALRAAGADDVFFAGAPRC